MHVCMQGVGVGVFSVCCSLQGGLGNTHFAGPTNQRPRECTLGETGESLLVEVIMKTIADIGLVRPVHTYVLHM